MAKNKNRDRKQPQTERSAPQDRPAGRETDEHTPQVTPGDMASRKRQKRFGHN
ncbi:hypothetical protein [Streptomyces tagetis]|uniref:Small hydrophilic protein n=1 Tax=Streptomyces tagetis TaxID=2820809 RepID=A0A940XNS5_9ACTN|nr:hypothetical protein [Streptomyces sp. RG38]MBQ0830477.1 hypothetical protein [Streptomyces sp. RG38]